MTTAAVPNIKPNRAWDSGESEQAWYALEEKLSDEEHALEQLLIKAATHDRVIQEIVRSIYSGASVYDIVDRVSYLQWATVAFCVQLNEAAKRRLGELPWSLEEMLNNGGKVITDMSDVAAKRVLKPIFEQSGIADRFESRDFLDKYPDIFSNMNGSK